MKARELAWLAGLLEGEAWFCLNGKGTAVHLDMTDEDVVRHVAALVGGNVRGPVNRVAGNKPVFRWSANGPRAAGLMMTVYPLMGERRQERIRSSLLEWRARPGRGRRPRAA